MSILDEIVAHKRQEVAAAQRAVSVEVLHQLIKKAPPPRDFLAALTGDHSSFRNSSFGTSPSGAPSLAPGESPRVNARPSGIPPLRLIAEVKKASPSAGVLRENFDPVAIAKIYQRHGAACISVLTDAPYFQGRLDHLRQIRAAVDLPLLRKDFIIERYQVFEARSAGADAVLLIAECLDDFALRDLHETILEFGMTPLVELYRSENLRRVLDIGAQLIGINNRDLHTFQVDLGHSIHLCNQIPAGRTVVAESGIRTRQDVLQLQSAGLHAMLVGETLMRQKDIGQAVDELIGQKSS
jgi:indole-3-glycerol phosphate synthase